MEEDGGREGRQEDTRENMKTERDCGREEEGWEEAIFILIQTATMEDPRTWAALQIVPEAHHTTTEADTSFLRGNTSVEQDVPLL